REVPREEEDVIGTIFEEPRGRSDGDARARDEAALLVRTAIRDERQIVPADPEEVEEDCRLRRGAIARDRLSAALEFIKTLPERRLDSRHPLGHPAVGRRVAHTPL